MEMMFLTSNSTWKKCNDNFVQLLIKSRIENVDNLLSVIIEKGLEIPCERSSEYYTVMNNQTEMTIITFYGEEKIATNNTRLGSIEIKDLPPLPKGEAKVTVTFKIDKDRNLSVKVLNMSSTSSMEAVYSGNNFTV
jgi:molecular chaperone DnaK (HSP70)